MIPSPSPETKLKLHGWHDLELLVQQTDITSIHSHFSAICIKLTTIIHTITHTYHLFAVNTLLGKQKHDVENHRQESTISSSKILCIESVISLECCLSYRINVTAIITVMASTQTETETTQVRHDWHCYQRKRWRRTPPVKSKSPSTRTTPTL